MIIQLLEWLNTALAQKGAKAGSPTSSAHVVFLALVAGSIFMVDARLLGLASRDLRFTYLSERLLPWTWGAFAGAVVTGVLMFLSSAVNYGTNTPFLIKMGLLVLAGLNMVFFQFATYRTVAAWDAGKAAPAARAAGIISIVCGPA